MHLSTTTYAISFTSLLLLFGSSIAQAIHQNNSPLPTISESQCPNGSERTMMGSVELDKFGIAHDLKRVEGASAEFADVCACPRPKRKFLCFLGKCDANSGGVCSQGGKSEAEMKNENETGNADTLCKAIDPKAKLVSIAPMKEKDGKYLKCACENGSNTFSLQSSSKTAVDKGLMERHKGTLDEKITSNSLFDEFGPDIIREISWAKENGTTQCDPERQKKAIDAEKTRVAAAKERESRAYNPPDKENKPEKKNPEDNQPKPGATTPAKEEKKPKEETKPKVDKKPTENVHGPKAPAEKKPESAPNSEPKKPKEHPAPSETPTQPEKPRVQKPAEKGPAAIAPTQKKPSAREIQNAKCQALGATSGSWADQCICSVDGYQFAISTESTKSCSVETKERKEKAEAEEKKKEEERQRKQKEQDEKKAAEEKIQKLCSEKGLKVSSSNLCECGNNYKFDPNKITGCPSLKQRTGYWWGKHKNLPDGLYYFPPATGGSGGSSSSRPWKWPSFKLPKIDPTGGWMNSK